MSQTASQQSLPNLNPVGSHNHGKRPTLKIHATDSSSYLAGNVDPEAGNKTISTLSMRQKILQRQRRSGLHDTSEALQPTPPPGNEYSNRQPVLYQPPQNTLPTIGQMPNSRTRNGNLTHKRLFERSRNSAHHAGLGQAKTQQSQSTASLANPQPYTRADFNYEVPAKQSAFSAIQAREGRKVTTSRNKDLQSSSTYELSNSKIFKSLYALQSCDPTPLREATTESKTRETDAQASTLSSKEEELSSSTKHMHLKEVDQQTLLHKQPSIDDSVKAYLDYHKKKQVKLEKELSEKQKSAQLHNWIQWGEPSEHLSDYQRMQESFSTFSQKDIFTMKKLSYIGQTNLKSLASRGKILLQFEQPATASVPPNVNQVLAPLSKRKSHSKLTITPRTLKKQVPQKPQALPKNKMQTVSFSNRQEKNDHPSEIPNERAKSLQSSVQSSQQQVTPIGTSAQGQRKESEEHIKDHLKIDTSALKQTQSAYLLTEADIVAKRRKSGLRQFREHVVTKVVANPTTIETTFNDNSSDGSSVMMQNEKQPLKAGFLKRFDFGMQTFLKNQRYNQGYVQATKYEQNYLKTILTSPWKQTTRVSKVQDPDRVKVLDYMTRELKEILQNVGERNFMQPIDRMNSLVLVCKLLNDPKPTIYAYQMYSCLLLHNDHIKEACQVLEVAKDLAHESQNLAQEMICYELIGKVLQVKGEFKLAKVAFKKMLQLAWLTRLSDYEYRAYTEIAKQYFYLEQVGKSKEYHMKALNGDMEKLENPERMISEELYRKKQQGEGDMGKYERMGCRVHRKGATKVIDYTQNFAEVVTAIEKIHAEAERIKDDPQIENKFALQMLELKSRKVGKMLIRLGTPVEQMQDEVHSPRLDHGDQLSTSNGQSLTLDSQRKGCFSPPQRDLRTILRTKPQHSPDYLTPMRENREYQESIRQKNEINFSEIKAKAKLRRHTQNKQKVQLRHLAYQGKLIHSQSSKLSSQQMSGTQAKQSSFHQQKVQLLKARQMRSKGQPSKGSEIEAIEQQRRLARDANKTEQVQKEINTYGYPLLEYLRKMKKCSFESVGEKTSRFGTKVQFFFYSDRRCQQVHDLLL